MISDPQLAMHSSHDGRGSETWKTGDYRDAKLHEASGNRLEMVWKIR